MKNNLLIISISSLFLLSACGPTSETEDSTPFSYITQNDVKLNINVITDSDVQVLFYLDKDVTDATYYDGQEIGSYEKLKGLVKKAQTTNGKLSGLLNIPDSKEYIYMYIPAKGFIKKIYIKNNEVSFLEVIK